MVAFWSRGESARASQTRTRVGAFHAAFPAFPFAAGRRRRVCQSFAASHRRIAPSHAFQGRRTGPPTCSMTCTPGLCTFTDPFLLVDALDSTGRAYAIRGQNGAGSCR